MLDEEPHLVPMIDRFGMATCASVGKQNARIVMIAAPHQRNPIDISDNAKLIITDGS